MNLFFRLLWFVIFTGGRSKVSSFGPCRTPFRCWLTDLDVFGHMNNSRYFSLMDLARFDLMRRSGLLAKLEKASWYPVVVAETITFKKMLKPWVQFEIETTVLGWDNKAFLLRQCFLDGDKVIADAIVRARFLKRSGGSVKVEELLNLAGVTEESPAIEPWIMAWNEAQIQAS